VNRTKATLAFSPESVDRCVAAKGVGSTLTLTHEMDPQWAAYEDQTRKGWTMILDSLAKVISHD